MLPNKSELAFRFIRVCRNSFWFKFMWYLIAAYIVWCLFLYFKQDSIIFPRHMAADPLAGPPGADVVVSRLNLDGGSVESWFFPAPSATAENPAPMVVFFHGNAELIDYQDALVQSYRLLGCSVLLPEYRGYGRSAGKPSQEAIVADAVRFHDELIRRDDVDATRILFHGRSLGASIAAALAEHRKPRALILESCFTSVAAMSRRRLVPAFLLKHPFRTDRFVARTEIPILIFHGKYDRIVPLSHAHKLRDLARNGRYVEYPCGHNDFPGPGNLLRYWKTISEFLGRTDMIQLAPSSAKMRAD